MQKKQYGLRFLSLLVLLLLASHVSAEVTSSYNSSTKTLTFSGSGVLTTDIVRSSGHRSDASIVEIGPEVTEIGKGAFKDLENIKTLDLKIATGLKTIGESAFQNAGLTSLTIPSSVTTIGTWAFLGSSLKTVEFAPSQNNLLNIKANAFTNGLGGGVIEEFRCYRDFTYEGMYNSYVEPDNSYGIFKSARNLTTVIFGGNATKVPHGSFWDCGNLTNLTIAGIYLKTIEANAFRSTGLTSLTIPSSVTTIGTWAFLGSPLKTIEFASSQEVLQVGANAFTNGTGSGAVESFNCYRDFTYEGMYNSNAVPVSSHGIFKNERNLTSVTFGDNATKVPHGSFLDCSNLKNLTITGTSVKTIEESAFESTGLTSLTIPASVTTIEKLAFCHAPLTYIEFAFSYATLNLGASVFSINGQSAHGVVETFNAHRPFTYAGSWDALNNKVVSGAGLFQYEDNLTSVTLLSMSNIPAKTFYNCYNLKTLTIGGELVNITYTTSNNLSNVFPYLQNLTIYSGVRSIGAYAFYDSRYLKSITIPSSVTSIGEDAFKKCPNVTNVNFDANTYDVWWNFVEPFANSITDLNIPNDAIANHGWTADGNLFKLFPNVQKVTFGRSVTQVGDYAFYDARPLEEVTFLNDITNVGKYSFNACINLTTINGSVKSVDEGSFQNTGINSIKITDDDTIDKNAFNGCGRLTMVELPGNLAVINDYAFYGCGMRSIELPSLSNRFVIGNSAFENCSALSSVTVPSTVTYFMDYAFRNCTWLASITLPNSTVMKTGVFDGCTNLKTVNIESSSIASTHRSATSNLGTIFPNATTVNFGENVTSLGNYAFVRHANLEEVSFASPCEVYLSSFRDCRKLRNVNGTVIPTGSECFANCSQLASIEIDGSTSTIGTFAFSGCRGLTKVVCYNRTPVDLTNNLNVFANVPVSYVELDVPYNSRSLYATAEIWKDFGDIFAIGGVKLQDGVAYTNTEDQEVTAIRYTRTFSSTQVGKWQALCIPFSIDVISDDYEIAEIFAFYPGHDTNGDGIVTAEDEDNLIVAPCKRGMTVPNVPYMVKPKKADEIVFSTENCTLHASNEGELNFSTTRKTYTIHGLLQNSVEANAVNKYFYMSATGNLSHMLEGQTTIKPNRWYMTMSNKVYGGGVVDDDSDANRAREIKVIAIGEDIDEETAIRLIEGDAIDKTSKSSDNAIYTINGLKVSDANNLPAGIYIKNGKKFMIK